MKEVPEPIDDVDVPQLLLTAEQMAAALSISPRMLWQLTHDGVIPVVRFGRAVRYSVRDLEAFIEGHKSSEGEHGEHLSGGTAANS